MLRGGESLGLLASPVCKLLSDEGCDAADLLERDRVSRIFLQIYGEVHGWVRARHCCGVALSIPSGLNRAESATQNKYSCTLACLTITNSVSHTSICYKLPSRRPRKTLLLSVVTFTIGCAISKMHFLRLHGKSLSRCGTVKHLTSAAF